MKNIISPKKSLNGDSILIFSKSISPIKHNATEDVSEIEHNIIRQAKYMVKVSGQLSTPELYDNGLMEILIQNTSPIFRYNTSLENICLIVALTDFHQLSQPPGQ